MNRIRLLSEQVANQIAAGEVVERPASVVKELVENALDAQARHVTVEIHAGGRSLIRVMDDGVGMSRDDALLCLERHATSKIQRAEDLSAVATLGFRGEALPSIASVCRFVLTTRERDDATPEGTQVIVNGGKIAAVKSCGSAPGTAIEARQLFFNLPARRKFLRAEETEFAHIHHYLTLAALAYPGVAFDFSKDGRTIWQLPAVKTENRLAALRERLRALSRSQPEMLPVEFAAPIQSQVGAESPEDEANGANDPAPEFRVWGFIGAPGVSRATREEQRIFVNQRPVENRGINFALLEGYHTALMKGRYPVCCLFIEISPAEVDVNIHPSKREIKFHREKAVRQLLTLAVRRTLLNYHAGSQTAPPPTSPVAASQSRVETDTAAGVTEPLSPAPPVTPDFPRFPPQPRPAPIPSWPPAAPATPSSSASAKSVPPVTPRSQLPPLTPARSAPPPTHPGASSPTPLLQVPLRLVGVIGRLYVVLESDRGLVLLDQHAAHERILFEQMLKRLEQAGAAPSQRLLLPQTVELPPREARFLRAQLATLARLGVALSEFGENTFLLDSLPPFVKVGDPRGFVLELVDELKAAGEPVNALRLGELTIAKTVCRHAVKANDFLAGRELENLIEDLRHCDMPYTCPHGRPTLIEMNFRELEKKFGRSQ